MPNPKRKRFEIRRKQKKLAKAAKTYGRLYKDFLILDKEVEQTNREIRVLVERNSQPSALEIASIQIRRKQIDARYAGLLHQIMGKEAKLGPVHFTKIGHELKEIVSVFNMEYGFFCRKYKIQLPGKNTEN
ncbi:MAG: hypothetical protein PHH08_02505 [Candidatus ainarchaeum sp.]|nr:hypothetical protein [Candidatus ainarchaeum sp.]